MKREIKCDNCGNDTYAAVYKLQNVRFIPGPIVKCPNCGLKYRLISLSEEELAQYYQKEEYGEESYLRDYGKEYVHYLPKSEIATYQDVLRLLEKHGTPKGSLLEIGCASGIFLDMAQKRGWTVMGVEVSPSLAEMARANFGINVITSQMENADLPGNYFDAVVMWDVIEHFMAPSEIIKMVRNNLKSNGIIVIFTQDNNSLLVTLGDFFARIGIKNFLYHLFDNYHLFFYTPRTLQFLLEQNHYEIMGTKHYPAEVAKRTWSDISIGFFIRLGTSLANGIAHLMGKDYRMVMIARKME